MAAQVRTLLLIAAIVTNCNSLVNDSTIDTPNVAPNIISRAEWGAKSPSNAISNLSENPPPYVIIHHSDTSGCITRAICQAKVRSIQNYHMNEKHWDDIGYNFLVGEDGNVYEGRGWNKRGAHSVKYNAKSIGICMLGDFQNRVPNTAAIDALQRLISWAVANGLIMESYTLYGHRQTARTLCPGDQLYNLIQTWPHWAQITP